MTELPIATKLRQIYIDKDAQEAIRMASRSAELIEKFYEVFSPIVKDGANPFKPELDFDKLVDHWQYEMKQGNESSYMWLRAIFLLHDLETRK